MDWERERSRSLLNESQETRLEKFLLTKSWGLLHPFETVIQPGKFRGFIHQHSRNEFDTSGSHSEAIIAEQSCCIVSQHEAAEADERRRRKLCR